jgi:hypothetical protein
MPKRRSFSERLSDPVDAAAFHCRRFWVPRGSAPDLSDDRYQFDPESPQLNLRVPRLMVGSVLLAALRY